MLNGRCASWRDAICSFSSLNPGHRFVYAQFRRLRKNQTVIQTNLVLIVPREFNAFNEKSSWCYPEILAMVSALVLCSRQASAAHGYSAEQSSSDGTPYS